MQSGIPIFLSGGFTLETLMFSRCSNFVSWGFGSWSAGDRWSKEGVPDVNKWSMMASGPAQVSTRFLSISDVGLYSLCNEWSSESSPAVYSVSAPLGFHSAFPSVSHSLLILLLCFRRRGWSHLGGWVYIFDGVNNVILFPTVGCNDVAAAEGVGIHLKIIY